jgi:hypothetical protein
MKRLNKKTLIIALIFIVIMIALLLLSLSSSPKAPPDSQTPSGNRIPTINSRTALPNPEQIKISLSPESLEALPKTAPLLTWDRAKSWENSIATSLDFSSPPRKTGNLAFWLSDNRSLAINTETLDLNYTVQNSGPLPWDQKYLEDFAIEQILKIFPDLKSQDPKIYPLIIEGEEIARVTTFSKANFLKISFFPSYKDFPIIGNSSQLGPITATFKRESNIFQIDATYISFFEQSIVELISAEEAIKLLEEGKGTTINLSSGTDLGLSVDQPLTPKSATITKVGIGYYLHPDKKDNLIPVYIFEGTSTTEKGNANIITLVPAIK